MSKSEEDLCKAAKEAALVCAHDALPVTEVRVEASRGLRVFFVAELSYFQAVSVAHSILRRCVDGGWLSMVGCLAQALNVPIVPIDDLCDFFKDSQVRYLRFSVVRVGRRADGRRASRLFL